MAAYLGFIAVYLLVYGALNYCCWRKLRHLFHRQLYRRLFMAFFILPLAAPILTRAAERNGWLVTARAIAWPGYLWMGFAFLFAVIVLLLDAATGLLVILRRRRADSAPAIPPRIFKLTGPVAAGLALLLTLYGIFAARQVGVEQFTIATGKLPAATPRLRLVQISDLHISIITGDDWVRGIIAQVRALQPDLVLATGDIADGDMAAHRTLADSFAALQPRFGKYAVTGNHEFYTGLAQALGWLNDAGFQVLRGESCNIAGVINLAGVDDYGPDSGARRSVDEREMLATLPPPGRFTLLLRHRPDVPPATIGLFDLQLSGHTHDGQIFPFTLIARLVTGRATGWHELGSGSRLYVSRGTGTWGPPMRVLAPPEITVFDLVRE